MTLPTLNQLLDNKTFVAVVSVIGGAFAGVVVVNLRNRLKTLEYTVQHDRIAFSAEDEIFGTIQVSWQGHNVTNLFTSRVELLNQTSTDFTNLEVRVYTGDTMLLGERTGIQGTTRILEHTNAYAQDIHIAEGGQPTDNQFYLYRHRRDYNLPVLNRGQKVIMTYLTLAPEGTTNHGVFLEILREGVKVEQRLLVPRTHGVPTVTATYIGLAACVAAYCLSSTIFTQSWAAALCCLLAGLFSTSIGAYVYRTLKFVKSIITP